MVNLNKGWSLSAQILGSLVILSLLASFSLIIVGRNALSTADGAAVARQKRLAQHALSTEIAALPEQQKSATSWDEAIVRTRRLDYEWIDSNLGSWMYSYFGHDESYILDSANAPLFASVQGRRVVSSTFEGRAPLIAPLVEDLRTRIASLSADTENKHIELAWLSLVEPVVFLDGPALVSVVPIVSDTGETIQAPGTEALHVAIRYVDAAFARQIGNPIELQQVTFASMSSDNEASIPLSDTKGNIVAWLRWEPDRLAMAVVMKLLPLLIICGLISVALIWWVTNRLLRISKQLHVSEAQARFLAHHDVLTGLPNRALFQEKVIQALRVADRTGKPLAIVALDLDDFKRINDTLGHPAGDELIRQVANRLASMLRAGDTVARFGGDEFMVLLQDMGDDESLHRVCSKIVEELSQPYALLGSFSSIGVSVGAVRAVSIDQDQADLFRRADIALYNAKSTGKNRYCLFEDDLTGAADSRNKLENDLRKALHSDLGLRVVYQPVYDAARHIISAEALCRWNHPTLGPLSPEIFIRIAEERGLIYDLGKWVLERACSFAARVQLTHIAVNVSPLQLRNKNFVTMVLEVLKTSGLSPERLKLELTEKAVLDRSQQIHQALVQLRAEGIRIALDDFATGNSSLQHLRDHKVDCVKIDRTFIARVGEDPECDELVQAIIGMAHAMKISVTVEGVETEQQKLLLEAMGCRSFQGYAFNAPMEQDQLIKLLQQDEWTNYRK